MKLALDVCKEPQLMENLKKIGNGSNSKLPLKFHLATVYFQAVTTVSLKNTFYYVCGHFLPLLDSQQRDFRNQGTAL